MPLALTITADEDGLTLTVSDSSGGTVTAYTAGYRGEEGGLVWSTAGSRVGNGTITLALQPGHYWVSIEEAGVWVAPVYAVVPTVESVRSRCREAIATRIRALGLSATDSESVTTELPVYTRQNFAAGLTMRFPCVEVRRQKAADRDVSSLNNRDDIGYGFIVLVKARTGTGPTSDAALDRHDGYYQAIARAFRQQRLPGVNECIRCLVEEGPEIDETFPDFELISGALTVVSVCREPRGLGA